MNISKFILWASLASIVAMLSINSAWANPRLEHRPNYNAHLGNLGHYGGHRDHGHNFRHWNFSVGPTFRPWSYPPYYYDPFFYRQHWNDRPIIIERPAPQVYIEQPQLYSQPAPVQQLDARNYWYFCDAAQAYFPYVKECPSGWQRVVPQPPPPQ